MNDNGTKKIFVSQISFNLARRFMIVFKPSSKQMKTWTFDFYSCHDYVPLKYFL
jgi:hypothetical protein